MDTITHRRIFSASSRSASILASVRHLTDRQFQARAGVDPRHGDDSATYLTGGPALFFTQFKDTDSFMPNNQRKNDTSVGVKAGAGVTFHLTKAIALFGEYRFTHFKAGGTFNDTTLPPSQATVKAAFDTHHAMQSRVFHSGFNHFSL